MIITLEDTYRDKLFSFFHESYGSLIFVISLFIISFVYFKLLNKELTFD